MDFKLEFRCDLVRILLASRNDYVPSPRPIELACLGGPAPGRRVPCGDCARRGRVISRGRQIPCLLCEGTGWRLRRKGEPAWDEYTNEAVSTSTDKPSTLAVMSSAQIDAELSKLRADAAGRDGRVARDEAYGWELARERRDAGGSYRELERALERLASVSSEDRHLLGLIYDSGLPITLDDAARRREQRAVEWLAEAITGQIRVPRWGYEQLLPKRALKVRELHADGVVEQEIARAVGASRRFVKSVLAGALHVRPYWYNSGVAAAAPMPLAGS